MFYPSFAKFRVVLPDKPMQLLTCWMPGKVQLRYD